jgi:hypothetical protein
MSQRGMAVGVVVAWASACAASGCGFEGSAGRTMAPDAMDALPADPEVGVDAGPLPPSVTCEGFTPIAGSFYRLLDGTVPWETALLRCAALPGAHLVTFETIAEPAAVVTGLGLTGATPAWTGVEQRVNLGQSGPADDWYNRVGTVRVPIPVGFPWRGGEPNDFTAPEDRQEDFAELHSPGVFDDAGGGRLSRPLCECVPQP